MQWKTIFCSVLLAAPVMAVAQNSHNNGNASNKVHNDGRMIAMRDVAEHAPPVTLETAPPVLDSIAPKALPFSMAGNNTKPIETESKPDPKSKVAKSVPKDNALAASEKPLPRVLEANDRFKQVPLAGELDYYGKMNGYMVDYVKKYMNNFAKSLNVVSGRGVGAFEVIDNILKSYSIPKELKYLAVIESALNKNARSPVGAVGYWQFMAPTAKLMGLTVNGKRDERKDLDKSTHAAAKYLSYLYDQLDDWLLVVAAYNSGPRPVLNAIKKTGESDFWAIKPYLPKETQNHVMAFVATATIMERMSHFLMPGLPVNFDWASLEVTRADKVAEKKPVNAFLSKFGEEEIKQMALVRIKAPLDLEVLASVLSVDRRLLGKWNYDYFDFLETYKKGNTYNLRIPKDKLDVYIEKKDFIEKSSLIKL